MTRRHAAAMHELQKRALLAAGVIVVHSTQSDNHDRGNAARTRAPNRERGREWGTEMFRQDYIGDPGLGLNAVARFNEQEFIRRFRLSRELFHYLVQLLASEYKYFRQSNDAAGVEGFPGDVKVAAGLVQLTQAEPSASVEAYFRMSESTVRDCRRHLCAGIVKLLEKEVIKAPEGQALVNSERRFREAGLPGCISVIDCTSWRWNGCPSAWKGLFQGKEGCPSTRYELVTDLDFRIVGLSVGFAGSCNDLTCLGYSNYMNRFKYGSYPPTPLPSELADHHIFVIGDGIYPSLPYLFPPIAQAVTNYERYFNYVHSSVRKGVECLISVLKKRFKVLANPCLYWTMDDVVLCIKTCAILQNLITETRHVQFGIQLGTLDPESEEIPQMLRYVADADELAGGHARRDEYAAMLWNARGASTAP